LVWHNVLKRDPLPQFEGIDDIALQYQVSRDLRGEDPGPVTLLWDIQPVVKILRRQQEDGSWKYPKKKTDPIEISGYKQLETFRQLGILVEQYLLNRAHPSVQRAADFLFSCQTEEGDFRGIYRHQYSPNYTAAYLEILIKAGFIHDEPIERGLRWLLSIRQDDGGWTVPLRTEYLRWGEAIGLTEPVQPRREKRFSQMITGVVLRAFAAHPEYNRHVDVLQAGERLASQIFKADSYTDRRAAEYWTRITFPFWFTDVLSALDSLSRLGFSADHPKIREAINWFVDKQKNDGSWSLYLLKGARIKYYHLWVALVLCRMLKRFFG
jgi:hypothetical protein